VLKSSTEEMRSRLRTPIHGWERNSLSRHGSLEENKNKGMSYFAAPSEAKSVP
jgi:hypothetical protein